ncbi:hypothetical protein BTI_1024 [Burkholderia thailandensis MSMB121]|nr:hypothetical protein BTI_1024 [Burkholderia thailandensis MSMB121]
MSSINAISSAISRLCGSAAICGGRSTGRAARKRASTSWVRSVDAFASHVVRAWLRLVAPFSSYAVRSIGASRENLCAHRRRLPSCLGPSRVFRHRSSGRTYPPAHLDSFASVTALPHLQSPNTFIEAHSAPPKKISRRSKDQIIPIIDPLDQYAAASLAQAYLSDNDYRNTLPMRRRRTTISTRLSCLLDMHTCRRRTSTFRRVLNFKDSRRFFRFRH